MSTALVLASSNGEQKTYSAEYRAAVKRTMRHREYRNGDWAELEIAPEEVDFLLFKATAYGLDPLKGQIYATWRNGRIQVEATFDGLRSLAERTGAYRGQTKPEWCDKEGNWSEIWLEEGPPAAARVGIRREGFPEPVCVPVHFGEFKQTQRNGELVAMWRRSPPTCWPRPRPRWACGPPSPKWPPASTPTSRWPVAEGGGVPTA